MVTIMKKLLATTALLTIFSVSAIAEESSWYLTFDRSVLASFGEDYLSKNKDKSSKDSGLFSNSMYRFGVGVHALEMLRVDLSVLQINALQKNKFDNDSYINYAMDSMAIMGKISFDIPIADTSTFFVGGSVGIGNSKFTNANLVNKKDIETISSGNSRISGSGFACGVNFGFSFPLSDNLDLNIEGSYLRLGQIDSDETGKKLEGDEIISLNISTISMGFRFYL